MNKIEALNSHQLKDVYGLLQNYFNSNENVEEWEQLSAAQKEKINIGIAQADAGNTKPVAEVIADSRRKYTIDDVI